MMRALRALGTPRNPAPGGALLHPVLLLSLCVLIVNDHVLKRWAPGVLSGKLSDFAVLVLLPLLLHGVLELLIERVGGRPLTAGENHRMLYGCLVLSLLVFALPEVWPPAATAYRYGFAALRYPFKLLFSLASGKNAPHFVPVRATADVTDLLALPMGFVAYRVGRRSPDQLSAVSHSA
jgi:hypothetical protein